MKQDDKLFRYLLWGIGLLPTLWLAMVFAQPLPFAQTALVGHLEVLSNALETPFSLRWTQDCPRLLLLFGLLYVAAAIAVESSRPNLRPGVEHGSAGWGNPRALNAKFAQSGFENIILTQNVKLGLDVEIIEHTTLTLYITLTGMNYLEAADWYWFTADERAMLNDLMSPEFVPLFSNLLGTDPYGGINVGGILQALPPNTHGSAVVQVALTKVGSKYVWGAHGPDQFDCSGFVYWCLKESGYAYAGSLYTSAAVRRNTATTAAGSSSRAICSRAISSSGRMRPAPKATVGVRSITPASTSAMERSSKRVPPRAASSSAKSGRPRAIRWCTARG